MSDFVGLWDLLCKHINQNKILCHFVLCDRRSFDGLYLTGCGGVGTFCVCLILKLSPVLVFSTQIKFRPR